MTAKVKLGNQIAGAVYFQSELQAPDFGMKATGTYASVSALAGTDVWTTIGSYQVAFKNFIAFGYGGVTDQGRDDRLSTVIKVYSATGQLTNGSLRLAVKNYNSLNTYPIVTNSLNAFSSGIKLGEDNRPVSFQGYLLIMINPLTTTTIDNTSASLSVTVPTSNYQLP